MEEPSVRTEHASDLVEERTHVGIRVRGLEVRDDVERRVVERKVLGVTDFELRASRAVRGAAERDRLR